MHIGINLVELQIKAIIEIMQKAVMQELMPLPDRKRGSAKKYDPRTDKCYDGKALPESPWKIAIKIHALTCLTFYQPNRFTPFSRTSTSFCPQSSESPVVRAVMIG